ncbi:hypothetical protein TRVA0_002S04764 [Trichomonascus vanleenenianus]|uniref:uncharacterized protein n=1 Tax=Trichomonascus vanleenenianus TaxID=2268995 RepID=UPI003ECA72A4
MYAAGLNPLLSPGFLMDRDRPKTGTTLTSFSKGKCLKLIEDRLSVLLYFKDTHMGRRPWLDTSTTITPHQWQQLYIPRRGARSYFSMGVAMASVTEKPLPDLKEYVAAVLTVLAAYDHYDSKKTFIPVENQATVASGSEIKHSSSSASLSSAVNHPNLNSGLSKLKSSRRFTLARTTSNASTVSPPSLQNTNSSGLSQVDESVSAYKPTIPPPNGMIAAKTKLPSTLAKSQQALAILASLKMPREEETELCFLPDPFQSFMSFMDALVIFFYTVSYQLRGRNLQFLELNEIEDILKSLDETVRRVISTEVLLTINPDFSSSSVHSQARDSEILEKQIVHLSHPSS